MADLLIRRAVSADIPDIRALTIRAYTKWIEVTPRPPRPMTADYDQAFADHRFDLLIDQGELIGLVETVPQDRELMIVNLASPQALYAEQRFSGHNVNIGVRQRREGTGRGFRG